MRKPIIDSEEYYGIKIKKDGTWLYNGTPITRHNLVKLFASVLHKDAAGDYWLITPYEKGRIEVEDVPFTAVEMRVEGAGTGQQLSFRSNIDEWVTLGAEHPLRVSPDMAGDENVPYIMMNKGLEARVVRSVYYDLVRLAVEDRCARDFLGVYSGGLFYRLGRKE